MNSFFTSKSSIINSPIVATVLYVGFVAALLFITVSSISDVIDLRGQVAGAFGDMGIGNQQQPHEFYAYPPCALLSQLQTWPRPPARPSGRATG